jgi:hypothetical protein
MSLFPYHDAGGRLYPELDDREVGIEVMATYLNVNRCTVYARVCARQYGVTRAEGAWLWRSAANPKSRGVWRFRPSVIWRRLGMGRWSLPGFDPRHLDGKGGVFCCDPAVTAKRLAMVPQPALPPELLQALTRISGAHLESMALLKRLGVPDSQAQLIPFGATQ